MKNITLLALLVLAMIGMGSCTNKEEDTGFETLTPKDPSEQKGAIGIDTVTVQMKIENGTIENKKHQ